MIPSTPRRSRARCYPSWSAAASRARPEGDHPNLRGEPDLHANGRHVGLVRHAYDVALVRAGARGRWGDHGVRAQNDRKAQHQGVLHRDHRMPAKNERASDGSKYLFAALSTWTDPEYRSFVRFCAAAKRVAPMVNPYVPPCKNAVNGAAVYTVSIPAVRTLPQCVTAAAEEEDRERGEEIEHLELDRPSSALAAREDLVALGEDDRHDHVEGDDESSQPCEQTEDQQDRRND